MIDERIKIEHLVGYARRMSADFELVSTTHVHKTGHWTIVEQGDVVVDGVAYSAPAAIWIGPGQIHTIRSASPDLRWLCVHLFPMGSEAAEAIGVNMDEVLVE